MRLAQREQAIGRAEGPTAPRRWLRCPDGLTLSLILYLYLYLTPPPPSPLSLHAPDAEASLGTSSDTHAWRRRRRAGAGACPIGPTAAAAGQPPQLKERARVEASAAQPRGPAKERSPTRTAARAAARAAVGRSRTRGPRGPPSRWLISGGIPAAQKCAAQCGEGRIHPQGSPTAG